MVVYLGSTGAGVCLRTQRVHPGQGRNLNSNQLFPVAGYTQRGITVDIEIAGNAMELLSGQRNRPNLSIPVAGNVVKDKYQVAAVGHPGGLLQQGSSRIYGLLFSIGGIENHDSAGFLIARIRSEEHTSEL